MKLAWFRAGTPQPTRPLDDTAALIAELRSVHDIEVFTAANAHDFVWKNFRAPYDLSVCELDNSAAHAFIWPYLLHYGGVVLLRTLVLHDSRAAALLRERRMQDYAAEFAFNHGPWPRRPPTALPLCHGKWPMLRVPLLASRVAIVSHPSTAAALQEANPGARVRFLRTGVQRVQGVRNVQGSTVTFGVLSTDRVEMVRRAVAEARETGAAALADDSSPERVLREADVIVSLPWPWFGEAQTPALAAMAAGKPVIVLETAATADWPALDPQTWRPRGLIPETPIAVSIDPRDEEHSLALAIRRLTTDATLRARLGNAAHAWWRAHATPRHAADDWGRLLAEAAPLDPPARPSDWPVHLSADGTECAHAILNECGVTVDLLSP
ncbi:MAG: hypothetical protein HYX77_00700 [Acidobacteria bacterium]|nr:hypothetical protein [Acidobacteriota bacterium]